MTAFLRGRIGHARALTRDQRRTRLGGGRQRPAVEPRGLSGHARLHRARRSQGPDLRDLHHRRRRAAARHRSPERHHRALHGPDHPHPDQGRVGDQRGHRHATHSFAFVAAVTYGTWAGEHYLGRYFTLSLVFFMLVLAVRALNLCPPGEKLEAYGPCVLLAGGGTVLMDRWIASAPSWLPFAIGLGALTHLAGDCLTDHGCRLFWPFTLRTGIPIIQRTGNRVETWFLAPAMAVGCAVLLYIKTASKP
ncbi:metal-dependent hydrolase [Catenulispora yoronensis]